MPFTSIEKRFIKDAGNFAQSFGLGRVVGEIYAYLYFSPVPRGLQDMRDTLNISKGSASMCVRQLEAWSAVNKVNLPGDRRDFYEANEWFGRVLKNVIVDVVARRFADRRGYYDELEAEMESIDDESHRTFLQSRLGHLRRFEAKARATWDSPILKRLLR